VIATTSRAEQEFRTWAASLTPSDLSDNEKKLLNLLLENFANLASLGTAGGLRAKKICELLDQQRGTLNSAYEGHLIAVSAEATSLKRIVSLEIPGAFRFAGQEQFLFDKECTIAYGPNGSGKSSFFEALELALLGEIEEANAKRIRLDDYIANDLSKQRSRPIVKGCDAEGTEMEISPSPVLYGFCFVEKNRIEKFARISATTEHEHIARIAALFGLDDFNRFVNEFTTRFAEVSDIDTAGRNGALLRERRETVRNSQSVLDTFEDKQREFRQAQSDLLKLAEWDGDFAELDSMLHGKFSEGKSTKGRLQELDAALLVTAEAEVSLPSPSAIEEAFEAFQTGWRQQAETRIALHEQLQKVSFRRLHQAVLDVERFNPNECPACSTPIGDTRANPFQRAKTELEALADIARLEETLQQQWISFAAASRAFLELTKLLNELFAKFQIPDSFQPRPELEAPTLSYSAALETESLAVIRHWALSRTAIATLREKVSESNARQRAVRERSNALQKEREKWRPISGMVKELIGREKATTEDRAKAEEAIKKFDAEQKELIAAASAEVDVIADNKLYVEAYNNLISRLRHYRDALPGKLVRGVCDAAQEFYNGMNEHDQEFEKLAALSLPSQANEIVEIRFKGEPEGTAHNALTILSEGHIRCLGLAILLAKNSQAHCPVLIFDDIVNAIDDDHRCAIARLLCSGNLLKEKQMILTSHGEEFTKVLETCFAASEAKCKVGRIDFLPAVDAPGIRVNHAASSRNYVVRSREHSRRTSFVNRWPMHAGR
jgi:energy-coupling factor transporter ATP-binding protein EcfA2